MNTNKNAPDRHYDSHGDRAEYLDSRVAEFMRHPVRNLLVLGMVVVGIWCLAATLVPRIFTLIGGW